MAKAKMGMMMTDLSGKLGGQVATRNRQGLAIRTKRTPVNRRSNSQQNSRSRLANLSDNWRALTQAQRDAWSSAAGDFKRTNVFGDSYSPTGKNLYQIINQNLLIAGSAAVSSPPASTPATALTSLSISTNTVASQDIAFVPTPVPATHVLVIEATRPLSAGVGAPGAQYRIVSVVAAAVASPEDVIAEYTTLFGVPVVGKKIFYRAYTIQTVSGLRSIPLQASGITV